MVDDPDGADAPMVGDHLVVMGTDGGTGLRRQLLRNVAERVLRRVAVSLMTVRKEDPDLLEFDETAGRRRTKAGRRGVPLLASSRSASESAFLPAGPDREGSVQIRIEESRKPSALSTPAARCRPRERSSLVMTKDALRLSNHALRARCALQCLHRRGSPSGRSAMPTASCRGGEAATRASPFQSARSQLTGRQKLARQSVLI